MKRVIPAAARLRALGTASLALPRRLIRAASLTVVAIAAIGITLPLAAHADVIINYAVSGSATVSAFECGLCTGSISFSGQFQYDSTSNTISSADVTVTGSLYDVALPPGGVVLTVPQNAFEDGSDLDVSSSDSLYGLAFEFTNPLSDDASDAILQTAYVNYQPEGNGDVGYAVFTDANSGLSPYHIGYDAVTGSAAPVPEPASGFLLGGFLLGFAVIRRRIARAPLAA